MTGVDDSKTNEFLRRRKLRLQQVREQSKDIAKKIRQRAKVENFRQVIELDSKKKKEYLQRQEQLVKKLEEYYAAGLENVGASHKNATEIKLQGGDGDRVDLSKQRGREAAAQLRKKRQQILDKQKELLDRKLLAREVANEISRDKSGAAINKLLPNLTNSVSDKPQSKSNINEFNQADNTKKDVEIVTSEMGTQWNLDEIPNEWEPNIPTLLLPNDDNSVKESNNNIVDSKSDKSKHLDLFAVSEEMPSSLCGGLTNQEEKVPFKSSLTLVSEYLQNRDLRLRESDTNRTNKKIEEFQSLKQTILRTRTSKEVSAKGEVSIVDKQLKSNKYADTNTSSRKSLVTVYNHNTRDSRDLPVNDERLVVRNSQDADDAYSQAMKESSTSHSHNKDHQKKVQEIRSKVAMTKKNVEKEYRDTISFLNALPKDKGDRPIKTAYMDEQRQQEQKDNRQQKLQQEYRKIEKECSKHNCKKKMRPKSRSPAKNNNDIFESTDLQYSWMPVPESDGNLAIHTIPTTLQEGKGNTVKFSKVDSYHEYRSRHKHTPPTKETTDRPRHVDSVDTSDVQDTSDVESISSGSTVQSVRIVKQDKKEATDAEKIIIYKILESKVDERKKTSKLMKNIAKSLSRIEQQRKVDEELKKNDVKKSSSNHNADNIVSFEQLDEGIYGSVNENGDNIASMYFHDKESQVTEEPNISKCCTNCKKPSKQSQKVPAPQQWDAGDDYQERSRSPCTRCNCSCKNVPLKGKGSLVSQPSTSTSATSFRTATNDKASNATSEGGFIKLIDEGGREAGKFYIGASGLLKNDAYEVVIQLRKKGDEKDSSNNASVDKRDKALGVDKVTVVSSTQTSVRDIYDGNENKPEVAPTSTVTIPQASKEPQTEPESYHSLPNRHSRQTVSDVLVQANKSVKDNEPIGSKIPEKSEAVNDANMQTLPEPQPPPARAATSTYTQTTLNSPSHRPVLFHMSSSTSTAYMSPPEVIVPKFMRPEYNITEDDMYDTGDYAEEEMISERHDYSEEVNCSCRKCIHARRLTLNNRAPNHRCRSKRNPRTPPNTAVSIHSEEAAQIYFDEVKDMIKKSNHKSRRCASHTHKQDDTDSLVCKKSRHSAPSKLSSRNLTIRIPPSSTPSSRKGQITSKISKTGLKPTIKNYVDKLLELNKESLKAVQVVDQDCSEVTTPGSSVINIPNNINEHQPNLENKLSLEKIRDILKQKIIDEGNKSKNKVDNDNNKQNAQMCYRVQISKNAKLPKMHHQKRKTAHKVKSLNISKKMSRVQASYDSQTSHHKPFYSSSSTKMGCKSKHSTLATSRSKIRSKSSPTPRLPPNSDTTDRSGNSDLPHTKFNIPKHRSPFSKSNFKSTNLKAHNFEALHVSGSSNHAMTITSNDSDKISLKRNNVEVPMSISTQTSINVDSEVNYMKLAEDKLQNMEKIADLTEKCTKRLSNLAKVLEEVRKNKTLAYSHMSTSDATSDSDQKSDKNTINIVPPLEPSIEIEKKSEQTCLTQSDLNKSNTLKENDNLNSTEYIPFLSNIPKPVAFKSLNSDFSINSSSSSSRKSNSSPVHENMDPSNKHRAKPPPALSRIHLKHAQDFVIPHELSTVVEVDSPMSIKLKSSRNDTKTDAPDTLSNRGNEVQKDHLHSSSVELNLGDAKNPDLLDNNVFNEQQKKSVMKQSDNMDSKIQMIDLEQFNEIMLKPFFSIQEYAKKCNVGTLDDGSNLDEILKDDHINDELSSLHSEASLPDVISELLKRNIISEPFKFDSGSNANSTTLSSESTISVLALSRVRHGPKKSNTFKNKDNIGETSDTMSISSNPDLENAFKKLGMGWASSTLKKTKERLALSSSSNTSSSSLSQFKVKCFNQEVPEPLTETISSVLSLPNKAQQHTAADNSKNAGQQTSKTNSMTVKEFLTNELANKITFNNKSKNDTAEEFASLFETKMPEEMKRSSLMVREDHSIDTSGNNNRARTSTPVQLYKSMTYHSSSSSNISNGLFSNADDLSSVKVTSTSMKHSTSDKDDLIIPNLSLRMKKGSFDCSKSD